MGNEYYGAPTTPTSDYLAHYGVKGMKWGVRKAIQSGNSRALGRQFKKAQKKLAKLERQAASGKKYAKRAAVLGVGAAAAGGLAAAGTHGVGNAITGGGKLAGNAMKGLGMAGRNLSLTMQKAGIRGSGRVAAASNALTKAGFRTSLAANNAGSAVKTWGKGRVNVGKGVHQMAAKAGLGEYGNKAHKYLNKLTGDGTVSRNTLARAGAAGVGLGLAGGAAYNAYRAATTKKAAAKAAAFRKEMNKAFAGTQYANAPRTPQKRRRRR